MNKKNDKKFRKRLRKNNNMILYKTSQMFIELIEADKEVHESYLGFQERFNKRTIKFLRKIGAL